MPTGPDRQSTRTITITASGVTIEAMLNSSATAGLIWQSLPVGARAGTWGDEVYFAIPVHSEGDPAASDVVPLGAVGYWPPGNALCLFFGPTPVSRAGECRGASPITVVGQIKGDATLLRKVAAGDEVRVAWSGVS